MSFRTVVVKNRSKLDLKLNYLVCRNDQEQKVYIPEISVLILESTAISITTALLSELVKNNVKVIFCDEKHNPQSELTAYYGNYQSPKRLKEQISWNENIMGLVWSYIVKDKIKKQSQLLLQNNLKDEAELLESYIPNVQYKDITNREGFSAKVYFNALFGKDFARRQEADTNTALNYGYAIVLSCFNREIVKNGYITQLGIFHKNEFNFYNLASDLMEPFRILVDKIVVAMNGDYTHYKDKILEIFNTEVTIDGKRQMFENAINKYCSSVFDALSHGDPSLIKFYEM